MQKLISAFVTAALVIACPFASQAAKSPAKGRSHVDAVHSWKAIASANDSIRFIDSRSVVLVGAAKYRYWELEVYNTEVVSNDRRRYDLVSYLVDCQNRTIASLNGQSYVGGNSTKTWGKSSPQVLLPESVGEVEWLFVCEKRDPYPTLPAQESIQSAIQYAVGVRDNYIVSIALSNDDLNRVATEYWDAFKETGMSGVSIAVQNCYDSILKMSGDEQRKRAVYCVTMDLIGVRLDAAFQKELAKQASHAVPPTPFYENNLVKDRLIKYVPYTTETHNYPNADAFDGFLNDAEKKVLELMSESEKASQ